MEGQIISNRRNETTDIDKWCYHMLPFDHSLAVSSNSTLVQKLMLELGLFVLHPLVDEKRISLATQAKELF